MQCDCYHWFVFLLGRVFRETLSVFTGLPYHSVIPLCVMTAQYTDNQAPGLGFSGSQHSFSVWKGWRNQLSPSSDGVHHRDVQHGTLNCSTMCVFLKMQSIQWQWKWWMRMVDWEVYLVILCIKSPRSCSSRVNKVSGKADNRRKKLAVASGYLLMVTQCESMRLQWILWLLLILHADLNNDEPPSLVGIAAL